MNAVNIVNFGIDLDTLYYDVYGKEMILIFLY